MPWEIRLFDRAWQTEDLTIAEAEALEDELGCSWLLLNPMVSVKHLRAVATMFLAREMDRGAATEKISTLRMADLGDAIHKVDDTRPTMFEDGRPDPKAEGSPPTGGSSPAPGGSGGPPTSPDGKGSGT